MLEFQGEFEVKAPRETVWKTFLDPDEMKDCMPDLQLLEVLDPDHYRMVVKVGVGFIKGKFDFDVEVVEREEPNHARLKAHGKGRGSAVDVDATLDLAQKSESTQVKWHADTTMVGRMASVGARLVRSTAEKRIKEALFCVQHLVEEGAPPPKRRWKGAG